MIRRLDGLSTLLLATIFTAFLLFSCAAKQAPHEITVKVPDNYSGELSLDPCTPGSSAQVTVNSKGSGQTSACPKPGEEVSLTVVQSGLEYRVPRDHLKIERAGDGLPVAIKARVPVQ